MYVSSSSPTVVRTRISNPTLRVGSAAYEFARVEESRMRTSDLAELARVVAQVVIQVGRATDSVKSLCKN